MKGLLTFILMIFPIMSVYAELPDIRIQMLDSEIEKLTHERDEKYAKLQECAKNTKGFKIAGITTLTVAGVGVAVNIGEAVAIKKNDKKIEDKEIEIKAKKQEIEKRKSEEEARNNAAQQTNASNNSNSDTDVGVSGEGEGTEDNLSSVDTSIDGTQAYALNIDGKCDYFDGGQDFVYDADAAKCPGLSNGQWSVTFSYGMVKGECVCSSVRYGAPHSSNDNDGGNIWCKMTEFNGRSVTSRWVYNGFSETNDLCKNACAYNCAEDARNDADFRRGLFDSFAK